MLGGMPLPGPVKIDLEKNIVLISYFLASPNPMFWIHYRDNFILLFFHLELTSGFGFMCHGPLCMKRNRKKISLHKIWYFENVSI